MRKLNLKDVSKVTKIIKNLDIKTYYKTLLREVNLDEISKLQVELLTEKDAEKIKTINQQIAMLTETAKKNMSIDIILYIIEKYEDVEESLIEFIANYINEEAEVVKNKDLDTIIECLKDIWENGMPNVLKTLIKSQVNLEEIEDEVKKNMS
jgi:hypothetical protein